MSSQAMEKQNMQSDEQLDMENSAAKQESSGQFVRKVSSSGSVLKFKVDKYGTPSLNSTILPKAVRFSDKESGPARLENCGPMEKDPLLQESEMIISNADSGNNTSFMDNTEIGPHPKEVSNRVDRGATMITNVAADNSAKGVYETSSSEIAKLDNTGNIILGKGPQENLLAIAVDNGSGGCETDEMHACHQCAKSFKTIESLNGHMGKYRREEYQHIRESLLQQASMEISETSAELSPRSYHQKEKREVREIWKASHSLVNISRESWWQQLEHGAKAIDVLAGSETSPNTDMSGYTEEMREVAEIMIEMAYKDNEDNVKMPSSPSLGVFMCTTCNKTFDSYQSLQDHMFSHNKPKKIKVDDTAGSSNGSSKRRNLYKCKKCNKTFATGQSLGGHKRKHWWENYWMMKAAHKNVKPPVQPLEPAVLVDVKVQYASTELFICRSH